MREKQSIEDEEWKPEAKHERSELDWERMMGCEGPIPMVKVFR